MFEPLPSAPEAAPDPESQPSFPTPGNFDHYHDQWVAYVPGSGRIIGASSDFEALMHEIDKANLSHHDVEVRFISHPDDYHRDVGGEG